MKVREIISFVLPPIATAAFILTTAMPIQIEGSSMANTLYDGDYAVVSKLGLNKKSIQRFDVVVLDSDILNEKIIKRVIGLPGEKITYKNDKLYVDGIHIEETFLDKEFVEKSKKESGVDVFTENFSVTLDSDEYYCLGDNRLHSTDSRVLGAFTLEDILGKEGYVVFPPSHIGEIS